MDLKKGDLVFSVAGHDKGQLFCVMDAQGKTLLLANGKQRKIESPKGKKRRHVCPAGAFEHPILHRIRVGESVGDAELRRALAEFRDVHEHDQRGQNIGGEG